MSEYRWRRWSVGLSRPFVKGVVAAIGALLLMAGGSLPSAVAAPGPAGVFAYVGIGLEGSVAVVDTRTNKVRTTIALPPPPPGYGREGPSGLALAPGGRRLYATSPFGAVLVINTLTNRVLRSIPVGEGPRGVVVAPDGRHVYVTAEAAGAVVVIDTATNRVVRTIPMNFRGWSMDPIGVVITPDGSHVYVSNFGISGPVAIPGTVSVIDTATNTVTKTITFTSAHPTPAGIAMAPDGHHVYVSLFNSGNVAVIDTSTNTVTGSVVVGSFPGNLAVTPNGRRLYVPLVNESTANSSVTVVDTSTGSATGSIPVGPSPASVAITPNGRGAYVTNENGGTVSLINTLINRVVRTIRVGTTSFPEPGPIVVGRIP